MAEPKKYTVTEIAAAMVRAADIRERSWDCTLGRRGRHTIYFDEAAKRAAPNDPDLAAIAYYGALMGELSDWARTFLAKQL
jgi:hypothetical protein